MDALWMLLLLLFLCLSSRAKRLVGVGLIAGGWGQCASVVVQELWHTLMLQQEAVDSEAPRRHIACK